MTLTRGDQEGRRQCFGCRSKSLDEIPPGAYEVAVSMGCGDACPAVQAGRRLEWEIPDPKTLPPEEFRSARDLIERKVTELLQSL